MKYLLVFLLILLSSCVQVNHIYQLENNKPDLMPISIDLISTQAINYQAKKALFAEKNQTLYVLDELNNEIYFYKNNKLINRVKQGSAGKYSLQKIADICLANDGNLWALDYFDKAIIKLDSNGMPLTHFTLKETINPVSFALLENSGVYVYDKAKNEILVYEPLTMKYIYSFAKMLFADNPYLSINKERLWAYDNKLSKTFIFSTTGKMLTEREGQAFYDRFFNLFSFENGLLKNEINNANYPISFQNTGVISINDNHLTQISDKQIYIYKAQYETK
ncbi:MAG: hypothetical protein RBS16_01005 [Candidatus Cloacimonadales bacterium]|jgi:hypothetical protein|nr:hypothetical protein [Candidatus Cloacimonadota bacterium]MDD2649631.1 hypothetical protein [Candidatus Cloacimonadota bacterium]MDD3501104.1 hypothetical protein [Candidatus Cloacimonadota bacterium]MDX9976591.1 hypothetical protein [Candidatus Cloacimonadales bacterium]